MTQDPYAQSPDPYSGQPYDPYGGQEPQMNPNVVGRRVGAAIIDLIIIVVIFSFVVALFGETDTATDDGVGFEFQLGTAGALLSLAVGFGYYILFEGAMGKTPGKAVLGIRVVGLDGRPVTWGASIGRNLLRIVDQLPFLYLVGFICVLVSQNRQRVGDMAAKTLVVRG